jgi:hypothetical protein
LRHLHAILAKHAADAKELSLAIDLGSAWTFAYVDAVVCLGEDLYTSEREHWLRSAAASEVETINAILSEQPIDIDVASRRLRYEVRRVHVAAIAWIDAHEEGRDTLALLEAAIGDIAAAIGNQRPLIQPLGILSIAAWISTNATVPSRVLDELRFASATAPGVRVAIGEPAPGIVGFRTSHIEALEAQRIAQLAGRREGRVTRYHDIALCALATANIEHSRRFVQRELGRLASRDDTTRRLAATMRTYLDENGSRGRTAKRLHVHENTVAYRLRQAEELLGKAHPRAARRARPGRSGQQRAGHEPLRVRRQNGTRRPRHDRPQHFSSKFLTANAFDMARSTSCAGRLAPCPKRHDWTSRPAPGNTTHGQRPAHQRRLCHQVRVPIQRADTHASRRITDLPPAVEVGLGCESALAAPDFGG